MERTKGRAARLVMAAVTTLALAAALVPAMGATDAWAKAPKKPGKPKAVKAQAKSSSSVTVRWGKAKRAKAYQVKVMRGSRTVKAVTVTKRSATVTGLSAGTTYKAKVRAQARKGKKARWGSWSKTATVRTKAAPKASSKPAAKPHVHRYVTYEATAADGSTYLTWECATCGREATSRPSEAECAHEGYAGAGLADGVWELVPGTFRTTGNHKVTYRYCLQCGESWRDSNGSASKTLRAHVAETGHLTKDNDGVTHDTVVLGDVAFEQGKEPYERCRSCGATRAHSHSWKHEGDELDKAAMGGFDEVSIGGGFECNTCGFRTTPASGWMNRDELDDSHFFGAHSSANHIWGDNSHQSCKNYTIYGQVYKSFAHDHCTVCGLNRVA